MYSYTYIVVMLLILLMLLCPNCNFTTVMNHEVTIFGDRSLAMEL